MIILRRMNPTSVLISLLLLTGAAGCQNREGNDTGDARSYHIKGLVMALEPARKRVVIAHEEIPRYMKAMTMPFTVRDTMVLQGIEVGDSVRVVLVVNKSRALLDSITVIAKVPLSETR